MKSTRRPGTKPRRASGIDRNSGKPLYYQIKRKLLDLIQSGRWAAGDVLPGEHDLATRFGVSRMTVRHALSELEAEGSVCRQQGRGTWVAPAKTVEAFLFGFGGMSNYFAQKGRRVSTRLLEATLAEADDATRQALRLAPRSRVFHLVRLRLVEQAAILYEKCRIPSKLVPGIEKHDFSRESLYDVLREDYDLVPDIADETLEVLLANHTNAVLLDVPEGTPLLGVARVVYTKDGTPIHANDELFRADSFKFFTRVKRF
jgi:GntR family transcriptional regulator